MNKQMCHVMPFFLFVCLSTYNIPTITHDLYTICFNQANMYATAIIGHAPSIELYQTVPKTSSIKRVFLYLHGWGDRKEAGIARAHLLHMSGIDEPMVLFNFFDVCIDGKMDLSQTNFGQEQDILTTLYVLHACIESGIEVIDCFANSRGGAVIINTIAVLANQSNRYQSLFNKLSLDIHKREKILHAIKQGSVILEQPLVDLSLSLANGIRKIRHCISHLFDEQLSYFEKERMQSSITDLFDRMIAWPIVHLVAPLLTHYHPTILQPLEMVKLWPPDIKVIVHMQYYDTIVSNKAIVLFLAERVAANPMETYSILSSHTAGHYGEATRLYQFLAPFRQLYGGSYNEQYAENYYPLLAQAQDTAHSIGAFYQ